MTMIKEPEPVPQDHQALLALRRLVEEDLHQSLRIVSSAERLNPKETQKPVTCEEVSFRFTESLIEKYGIDCGQFADWATYALSPHEKSSLVYRLYLGRSGVLGRLVERYRTEVA